MTEQPVSPLRQRAGQLFDRIRWGRGPISEQIAFIERELIAVHAEATRAERKRCVEIAREYSAGIVCEGENETEEQRICNAHADGRVAGYNDAVRDVAEALAASDPGEGTHE